MILASTFQRKVFRVQAVQVAYDNIEDLAQWCGGRIFIHNPSSRQRFGDYQKRQLCIEIAVQQNGRKTRAYATDWITCIEGDDQGVFRVYRDKTFKKAFDGIAVPVSG